MKINQDNLLKIIDEIKDDSGTFKDIAGLDDLFDDLIIYLKDYLHDDNYIITRSEFQEITNELIMKLPEDDKSTFFKITALALLDMRIFKK